MRTEGVEPSSGSVDVKTSTSPTELRVKSSQPVLTVYTVAFSSYLRFTALIHVCCLSGSFRMGQLRRYIRAKIQSALSLITKPDCWYLATRAFSCQDGGAYILRAECWDA